MAEREIIRCVKCGKPLIHRLGDGSLEFVFGKKSGGHSAPPVQMQIYGNVKMRCFREKCGQVNMVALPPASMASSFVAAAVAAPKRTPFTDGFTEQYNRRRKSL